MQLTLASKASVILGPDQASGPMMDPRVERATDNCKDTEAYFFFLLHNVGDLSYPRELGG